MKITKALRSFVSEKFGVSPYVTDDEMQKFVSAKVADGSLSGVKFCELLHGDEAEQQNESQRLIKDFIQSTVNETLKGHTVSTPATTKATEVFGGGSTEIRVKPASEAYGYSTTKSVGKHSKLGCAVLDQRGKQVETPSELEYAKIGAYIKHCAASQRVGVNLTDHDRQLFAEIVEKDVWVGELRPNEFTDGISGPQVKTLLSDTGSGGLNINPYFWDEMLVSFPLLNGELFPQVHLVDIPRSASVLGGSMGNPTVTWGQAEGTEIAEFDTDDLVGQISATIHPVMVALEVGRDLMADSPADVGKWMVDNIGQRMLTELDRVTAVGNGSSEPEGIFSASGLTSVVTDVPGGLATVGDLYSLMFAIGKQYRNGGAYRPCFLANDTTYSRFIGIPVGSQDQRRVFGMDPSQYTALGWPFKVCNDIPNTQVAFGAMAKYRMYRRQGNEVRWVTEGAHLAKANSSLLVVRGRWGGRVVDSNAFAKSTTLQA